MRDEQYLALARAIKRPMRRWWLTVGSWWLGGGAVLLVLHAALVYQENLLGKAQQSNILSSFQLQAVLAMQLVSLTMFAAILCSRKAIWLVSQLCEFTPLNNTGKTAAFSFRLALFNCWPFLLPIVLMVMISHFQLGYASNEPLQLVCLGLAGGLERAAYCALFLLWIVALTTVKGVPIWVSWLFYLSTIASSGLLVLVWLAFPGHSLLFPVIHRIDLLQNIPLVVAVFLTALGAILLYCIVYLFCKGKVKQAVGLASFVCLHILLINLNIGFGVFPIDLAIQTSGYYLIGLHPYHFEYFTPYSQLNISIAGHTLAYPMPAVFAAFPPLMGAFWFALHYYLLNMMIRKVKPGGNNN